MREQPQLPVKGRWAALSTEPLQPRIAVGDNARQQRSTKPGDHSFEDGFCIVHAHGGNLSIVAGGGIREHNVSDVITRTGVREVHMRFVGEARMKDLIEIAKSR